MNSLTHTIFEHHYMAYARRENGFGGGGFKGGNKFGAAPRGGRSFSDHAGVKPTLYPATCGDCGNRCEVPFRPNGKKPVLCRSCFAQGDDFKPKFAKREDDARSTGHDATPELLRTISTKLDTIIKILNSRDISV